MLIMIKCPVCGYENKNNNVCVNCEFNLKSHSETNEKYGSRNIILSIILSMFLPGISYFYLRQWYRGFLFILLYPVLLFNFSMVGALYDSIFTLEFTSIVLLTLYILMYIIQIIDVIKITQQLNKE